MDDLTQARHDLAALQARYDADVGRLEVALTAALVEREDKVEEELEGEAVFGCFDGLVSVIGVIIGLLATTTTDIVLAAVGLAVASGCSMAAGEWLSDRRDEGALRRAGVMGAATVVGIMVPTTPFFLFSKHTAVAVASVLALLLALSIGRLRHQGWPGYVQTLAILVAVTGLSLFVGWLIPASVGG